jgi:hypothetical protein
MSGLGNAQSNRHRKTHAVESGEAGRESGRLTRGARLEESRGGVSSGLRHAAAWETAGSEGPKDHDTDHAHNL